MEGPVYRDGTWWQYGGTEPQWQKWEGGRWQSQDKSNFPFPPPPSRWHTWQTADSEPFYVFLLGVLAAILALGITVAVVQDKTLVAAILAPIIGVIGAFAGHAAGHASAISVMKQKT